MNRPQKTGNDVIAMQIDALGRRTTEKRTAQPESEIFY